MNYYMHRISDQVRYSLPLLHQEQPILSTGWGTVTIAGLDAYFNSPNKARNWPSLEKFVNMQLGDWVPHPYGGRFSIYEVTSALMDPITLGRTELKDAEGMPKPLADINLGFFFKVKEIAPDLRRSTYLKDGLSRSMKYGGTTLKMSQHAKAIRDVAEAYKNSKPINHQEEIITKLTPLLYTELQSMSSARFHELAKWYFIRVGASSVEMDDLEDGTDFIIEFAALQHQIYLQIHRTDGDNNWLTEEQDDLNTESAIVDNFSTVRWVITQNSFTDKERELASTNDVVLVDGNEFAQKLLQVGLNQMPI